MTEREIEHYFGVTDHTKSKNRIISVVNKQIKRFSIECRKAKTTVITTANQNEGKYSKEPMRTQSKYK